MRDFAPGIKYRIVAGDEVCLTLKGPTKKSVKSHDKSDAHVLT